MMYFQLLSYQDHLQEYSQLGGPLIYAEVVPKAHNKIAVPSSIEGTGYAVLDHSKQVI